MDYTIDNLGSEYHTDAMVIYSNKNWLHYHMHGSECLTLNWYGGYNIPDWI